MGLIGADRAVRVHRAVPVLRRSGGKSMILPKIRSDPRLHAFSLMGPMVMAMLFGEVFGGVAANPPDLQALADQHARTALTGLFTPGNRGADGWRTK